MFYCQQKHHFEWLFVIIIDEINKRHQVHHFLFSFDFQTTNTSYRQRILHLSDSGPISPCKDLHFYFFLFVAWTDRGLETFGKESHWILRSLTLQFEIRIQFIWNPVGMNQQSLRNIMLNFLWSWNCGISLRNVYLKNISSAYKVFINSFTFKQISAKRSKFEKKINKENMATVQRKLVHKQFNSPIGLYSDNNVKSTLNRELKAFSNGTMG